VKKPTGRGGKKHLAPDEENLWEHTARSIAPLKKAKSRVHASTEADEPQAPRTALKHPPQTSSASSVKPKAVTPPPPPFTKKVPPIAVFDRKKVRKIRSGAVDIEARIDLHGMRQDEAHSALVGFLRRCLGKGQRWVLVITGKGKASGDDADVPFDMTRDRGRGVLKRNVPRWLEEPDVRLMVVSYTTAAIQHGGEGALYVHLRTKR
jgi:DNA-nicking Smr family endonuclease